MRWKRDMTPEEKDAYYAYQNDCYRRQGDRSKLNAAFKLMRKRGLLALQAYQCCSNCAGYAITEKAVKLISSGRKNKEDIRGCCFYHRQDAEDRDKGRPFYVRYGNIDSEEYGEIGEDTEKVGRVVGEALKEAGVSYDWDGSPHVAIEITDW